MSRSTGNPTGRPSVLKNPARGAILMAIENGAPFCDACEAAGISYKTFKSWRAQGMADAKAGKKSAFSDFCASVKRAKATFVINGLERIKAASEKHWTAYAWLLERREPEKFADNRAELRRLAKQLAEVQEALVKILQQGRAGDS